MERSFSIGTAISSEEWRVTWEIPHDEFTPAVDNGQFIDATTCLSVADLNGDKIVNVSDLIVLLGTYGQSGLDENGNMPDGDVDQDGDVDVRDLLMLLSEWGRGAAPT